MCVCVHIVSSRETAETMHICKLRFCYICSPSSKFCELVGFIYFLSRILYYFILCVRIYDFSKMFHNQTVYFTVRQTENKFIEIEYKNPHTPIHFPPDGLMELHLTGVCCKSTQKCAQQSAQILRGHPQQQKKPEQPVSPLFNSKVAKNKKNQSKALANVGMFPYTQVCEFLKCNVNLKKKSN
jgi:hypothetical protein